MTMKLFCAIFVILVLVQSTFSQSLQCDTVNGWFNHFGSKCYRIFTGNDRRSYEWAQAVCKSYGSRLVTIKDQAENDVIGESVKAAAGRPETFYIGLSRQASDGCISCPELKWSNGDYTTDSIGFWSDNQPDEDEGDCVYVSPNKEQYCYDRPYTWNYGNCLSMKSFVCEKMAAPQGSFHCFRGGYVSQTKVCNNINDCMDGYDELNCPQFNHYYLRGSSGTLTSFSYQNARTYTWAIETPVGTNAYVKFLNIDTEFSADYIEVYIGSIIETEARRIDRISGQYQAKNYRSYNNMMLIKFSTDNVVVRSGFQATYHSLTLSQGNRISLVASNSVWNDYSLQRFTDASFNTFLSQNDYVITIETEDQSQLGPIITVEIEDVNLNRDDVLYFFDGDTPSDRLLSSYCHGDECNQFTTVYSTGKSMSILLRTFNGMMTDNILRFRYRQGCYFSSQADYGTIFTPGFINNIDYPNYVRCTWSINVGKPIAIYFDPNTQLRDENFDRKINGDYLKMTIDGEVTSGSSIFGLTTNDIRGMTFQSNGSIELTMMTSPTRSARGFLATWSIDCPNPNYDEFAQTNAVVYHYTSSMEVMCATGYDFHQEIIPEGTTSVTLECGFMGKWKNYRVIPRCTRKYCGPVPSISNGYVASASGVQYQDTVTYECFQGSTLQPAFGDDDNVIDCLANGQWTTTPTCTAKVCPNTLSTSILNGQGTGSGNSIGSIYRYTCNDGFKIVGDPEIICQEDGTWSQNDEPTCTRLKCLLPPITNGVYIGNTVGNLINTGQTVSYSCNTGYEKSDPLLTIRCENDQYVNTFNEQLCININECDISPCDTTCIDTEGSYYCECDAGYRLHSDGRTCLDIDECLEGLDECDEEGTCIDLEGSYRCACSDPYVLYTQDGTSGFNIPVSAGENGLLSTDTYHINHTCVLKECTAPTVQNAVLLTHRPVHRFGDHIEYKCDIGYRSTSSTVLQCGSDGNWVGTIPICEEARCNRENPGILVNSPTYVNDATYSYNYRLDLNCSRADGDFQKYRFCVYKDGDYVMEGAPYDCGEVDCEIPEQHEGTNPYIYINTRYNSQFEFSCADGSTPVGQTNEGSSSIVKCLATGYWDFGNLQCTGQSCTDPGRPLGGSIVATSFADQSQVTFTCDRDGYTLTNDVMLTCVGSNFNGAVPQCIDTTNPVIQNCPTESIDVPKYGLLRNYVSVQTITATDNTGVERFFANIPNVNSTYNVEDNVTITYTAIDFAGRSTPCNLDINVEDKEPPVITCPPFITVSLETTSDSETVTLDRNRFIINDNRNSISSFNVVQNIPRPITYNHLYETYTYVATATDTSGNQHSCRGQVFVEPKTCSELSFLNPLNADKNCTREFNGDLTCDVTCQTRYTFTDGKMKTIRCDATTGLWDTPWIPACVLDVLKPELTCPTSSPVYLKYDGDSHEVDFTTLTYIAIDLNYINEDSVIFSPTTYTFTKADLFKRKAILLSVSDIAGNTDSCSFEYTALPTEGSALSLTKPLGGSLDCVPTLNSFDNILGYRCTIACEGTTILRGVGPSTVVTSTINVPWDAASRFPTCIADTIAPTITQCPSSQIETISARNVDKVVDIVGNSRYLGTATDLNSVTISYSPETITLRESDLFTSKDIIMFATDAAGNVNTCTFHILVEPEECSELAFRRPANANTNCSYNGLTGDWTCDVTCFSGYSFYDDGLTERTITNCGYVPDCVNNNVFVPQQFIVTMQYDYIPQDSNIATVNPNCISYYSQVVANEYFISMSTRLKNTCTNIWFPMDGFEIQFLRESTQGEVVSNRKVNMRYKYSMYYSDRNILNLCVQEHDNSINGSQNTFPLRNNIQGSQDCPTLEWDQNAFIVSSDFFCSIPFYETTTGSTVCRRCPPGTESDSVTCNLCDKGYYKDGNNNVCQSCPLGWTTLDEGSTSLDDCFAPCSNGQVSFSGYEPCYLCPIGTYATSNTTCTPCDPGFTTTTRGATLSSQCVPITERYEPCSVGTQSDPGSDGVCELCPVGTYRSTTSQSVCSPCQNSLLSTYVEGAISSTQCFSRCSNGFISDTGRAPCQPCNKGEYWFNSTYCMTCPDGTTTKGQGSSSLSQCVNENNFRVACPRGTSRDSNGVCVKCDIGFYNRFENGVCQQCSSTKSSYFPGAVDENMCRNKCLPGFFSVNGRSPCSPCGSGRYSSIYGATSCDQCNNDQITYTNTATSITDCIDQCPAGYYSHNGYGRGNECQPCPANYYQNSIGSTGCIRCPSNTASNTVGLTSIDGCIASTICSSINNPCINGVCDFRNNEVVCDCDEGRNYGKFCQNDVNLCLSNPCYNNGLCTPTVGGYTCDCRGYATGNNCEDLIELCDTSQQTPTCANGGHCINYPGYTRCMCTSGYSGDNCLNKTDICTPSPCDSTGTFRCIDTSLDSDLRYFCECKAGYEGPLCQNEINECLSTPCVNGGQCRDELNDFFCECPTGYSGRYCQNRADFCSNVNCGSLDGKQPTCVDKYDIDEHICLCHLGYSYDDRGYTQYSITMDTVPTVVDSTQPQLGVDTLMGCRDACTLSTACVAFSFDNLRSNCYIWFRNTDMTAMTTVNYPLYHKHVNYPDDDFWTVRYSVGTSVQDTINDLRDDYGLEICDGTNILQSRCCRVGQDCDIEGSQCTFLSFNDPGFEIQFKCSVSRVYDNNQCSRKTDYCSSSPCVRGNCNVRIGGYVCSCPNGYSGKNCQTNINDCANNPCVNGVCEDDVGFYTCTCDELYTGTNCDIPKNNCLSNPCSEYGTCSNLPGVGFKCECLSGWEGETCNDRIQYCDRDLCVHGTCSLTLDSSSRSFFQCSCEDGWGGELCDEIIDYCSISNQGGQCQGDCRSVFQRYYCECPPNVFGTNCENQPTPCITYPKCINGQCSFNGSMYCDCPIGYKGDACHIQVDYCGQTNPCMNGATCENVGTFYTCRCPEGFIGPNCEDTVNYCDGVLCPGGTCINRRDGYVCRCPLGRTGANCNRAVDSNYDLYFNHPQGYCFAWIPYSVMVTDAKVLSVTAWVRYATDGGTGVYLTQFIGNDLETSMKFMEFYEDGVRVYIPGNSPAGLTYKSNAVLNDGDWHHVIIVCRMDTGSLTLYLDTIKQGTYVDQGLIMTDDVFSMWVVLGCEFDNENHRCEEGGDSFHGYLSQVHWYKMALTFDASPTSGISYNYEYPRLIFDSQDMSDVILVWHEYVLESGVTRMIGSEASGSSCDMFNRNPPCNLYQVTNLPSITNCPDDIHVYSAERTLKVSWDEPSYTNIGGGGVIPPSISPGSTLAWGVYDILYIAYDEANNYDYCSFRIYVQEGNCESPEQPFGGRQSCDIDSTGRKSCMISCLNSNTADYMIDRDHPNLFTCGPSGSWNAKKPFCKFRYPSCGVISSTPHYKAYVRVTYDISTSACNAVKTEFIFRTNQMLNILNDIYGNSLCVSSDCSDVNIVITCSNIRGDQGRRKRQTDPKDYYALMELFITATANSVVLDGETVSLEEFLTYFIVGNGTLDFNDTTISGNVERENYAIVVTSECPKSQVLLDGSCVQCGPGNYYKVGDDNVAYCEDCPVGTYQTVAGMDMCTNCTSGTTTELAGNYEATACKVSCDLGEYFSYTLDRCEPCAIGYYQDETGQFRCKHCPAGSTTRETGSQSRDDCSTSCDDGYQLNIAGTCEPCPIGYHRNATLYPICQPCDSVYITPGTGSVNEDACTIVACSAGNYRDVVNNVCKPCEIGYYQPTKWTTSCNACDNDLSSWLTLSTGSTQFSDCQYYCPSGYEVESVGSCLECPIGTYKDNDDGKLQMCQQCPGNYRTATVASTSSNDCNIYKCPAGYKPNDANTGCDACPIGSYQNVPESTDCIQCPSGTSTRQNASDSDTLCEAYCPSGEEKRGDICVQCSKGKYKNNDVDLYGMCVSCDPSFTTVGLGSTKEDDCNVLVCLAGTKRNPTETACIDCPLGTYQPLDLADNCITCPQFPEPTSTRDEKSTSLDDCETYCDSGYEKIGTQCIPCERGYYKNNAMDGLFGTCQLCPVQYITSGIASTSSNDCNVANCSAGTYRTAGNTCAYCEIGTYQDEHWQEDCKPCINPDTTTENEGSDSILDCILECAPGFEDIGGSCRQCAIGYYKPNPAAAACTRCVSGFITDSEGSTSSDDCVIPACPEGQYLDRSDPLNLQCRLCEYNTYQDEVWQDECKICPQPRDFTLELGSDEFSDCLTFCQSGFENDGLSCVECPIGYYRDASDVNQRTCQLCPLDRITLNTQSTSILDCSIANCTVAGTYRNPVTNTCELCPLGSYLNEKWLTECIGCPTGNYTSSTGSTNINDCKSVCPLGQYVNVNNQCELCEIGYYKDDIDADTCTQCPSGLFTVNRGADNVNDCNLSPCESGEKYIMNTLTCEPCEIGSYQPAPGQFQCTDCPGSIQYTQREGSISVDDCRSSCEVGEQFNQATETCEPCPSGTYQPKQFEFTCVPCPANRRYSVPGATSANQCYSYCAPQASNDCSVNATCTLSSVTTEGYTCTCFNNYDDTGSKPGRECAHSCDRGYCKNGATCERIPRVSCTCTEWYTGDRCESRLSADRLSDNTMNIIVPAAIAGGGALLLLIILAVCCLCWKRARKSKSRPPQYSEFNGDRMEKASVHSYGQPFYGQPQMLMLAPTQEIAYDQGYPASQLSQGAVIYDNQAYKGDLDRASSFNGSAIYQA